MARYLSLLMHPDRELFGFDYFDSLQSAKAKAAAAVAAAATPADAPAGTTSLAACAHSDADDASDADDPHGDGHSTSDCNDAEGDPEDVDDDDVSDDGSVAQRKPTNRHHKSPGTGLRKARPGTQPNVARARSGKKKTKCAKSAGSTLFELSPVTPRSRAELEIVLQILQDEQGRKTKLTMKEYEATARRYNAAVYQLYCKGSATAAGEVRYAPTTASLLQQCFRKERSAASRLQHEMALAHTAAAEDDATATSTLHQSIQNVIEASDAAADAANTLAAMPSSVPLTPRKRQRRSRDKENSTKHTRFEGNFRRQTIEVRLSDIRSWSESARTLPVRTLRRLARKLGVGGSCRKRPVVLVADVTRAWERDHPNTEVLTLDPEVQPEQGTE